MHSLGLHKNNPIIVSPDVGRVAVARAIAKRVDENVPIAVVDKRRPAPNQAEVLNVIGDVKDRVAIIIDDIVDTGGTLTKAVDAINDAGAKSIYAYITHPVLSGNAISKIESSSITKLIVTDSIPLGDKKCDNIEVVSVSGLLGEAIKRIQENKSVSSLFV
jgi:ribose-phosphate pyrophosphokinase